MDINFFLQLGINGLLLGGFYATATLGFSTIWGVMRLINLAHGEFLLMGAFTAWFFFNPNRESNLTIGVADKTVALVAMLIVGTVIGFTNSNHALLRARIPRDEPRFIAGGFIGGASAFILYLLWQSQDFGNITITMMFMVLVSLALSIGFMISHIILNTVLDIQDKRLRRSLGYGIGIETAIIFYALWQGGGFGSIDPFLSLPMLFVIFFALGYILQRQLLNKLVEGPYLTMLLVTFAIAIILQNIGIAIFRADPRKINVNYGNAFKLTDTLTIAPTKFFTVLVSVFMIIALVSFLRYTRIGYAIRAAAQDKMAARLMGINVYETYAITFGISLGLTAMAGGMMGTFQPVTPITGPIWTLRAFAIVALGGLGKVQGVVVGGLVLGLAESYIGGYVDTGWATAAAFVLLVTMLILRPQGITGGMVSAES